MVTLIVSIWLSGCIASYLAMKYEIVKIDKEKWTVEWRRFAIFLSLLSSWVNVIAISIRLLVTKENDKPASW